ncbi:MAG: tetraacyldisaccharide 4'-kinase, partial [Pseudomonadota bacterium]
RDDYRAVGDEPLMLSAYGPVWVARDRAAGAVAAAKAGAQLVLLDDGFQNPALVKDASLVMVDAVQGFGNGRVIPAGPLREPVAEGLARADAAVLVGPEAACRQTQTRWPALQSLPVIRAGLEPVPTGLPLQGAPVVAFAGIARPEKFFATVRSLGCTIIASHGFADHQPYSAQVIRRLIGEARGQGALLVTTEKDAVRLPPAFRSEVLTVQIRLEPQDWAPIDALIQRIIGAANPVN